MRVDLQPAYILHRRDFRNTSLIVDAFTPEYGRIGLVAKGVRRPRSLQNTSLQCFQPLLISWRGRGDLYTLTNVEVEHYVSPLFASSYASGFYINELLMRLLQRDDAHIELFDLYRLVLEDLRQHEDNMIAAERSLRLFEKHLLQELGYGLALDCDVSSGSEIDVDADYCYEFERGPVRYIKGQQVVGPVITGHSLLSLARNELHDESSLRDSKKLMRAVLRQYLGEKPLQSRMLYNRQLGRKRVKRETDCVGE